MNNDLEKFTTLTEIAIMGNLAHAFLSTGIEPTNDEWLFLYRTDSPTMRELSNIAHRIGCRPIVSFTESALPKDEAEKDMPARTDTIAAKLEAAEEVAIFLEILESIIKVQGTTQTPTLERARKALQKWKDMKDR